MSTLKDVAEHAGVSISTASRVINGKEYVSEETRQKVAQAIRELDYQPNLIAQSLVKGRETRQLGLLVYDISNSYFAEITMAFEAIAYQHDYTVILCNTAEGTRTLKYLDMFIQRQIDGVALIGSPLGQEEIRRLQILLQRGVPVVMAREKGWFANPLADILGNQSGIVEFDTVEGCRMAIDYLVSRGHRRIGGLFTVERNCLWDDPRARGFRQALEDNGIEIDDNLIISDLKTSQAGGFLGMGQLLQQSRDCTAVFAYNDVIAIGALAQCREQGIRVPDDLSVVSMDDTEDSLYTNPPLTSVRIPRREQGEFMAEYLLARIRGKTPPSCYSLPVYLALRQSVGNVPSKNVPTKNIPTKDVLTKNVP